MLYNTGAIRVIYLLHFHFQRFHCNHSPVVHGAMGCGQKSYKASVAVPPVPVQVPSQMQLAPSVTSVTSVANDLLFLYLPFVVLGNQFPFCYYINWSFQQLCSF